jgi:hypothetical protein
MPRSYSPKLRGKKLRDYGEVMARERAALVVPPERLEWILKTYPPSETGRPDLFADNVMRPTSVGRDVGPLEKFEEDGFIFWRPKIDT